VRRSVTPQARGIAKYFSFFAKSERPEPALTEGHFSLETGQYQSIPQLTEYLALASVTPVQRRRSARGAAKLANHGLGYTVFQASPGTIGSLNEPIT